MKSNKIILLLLIVAAVLTFSSCYIFGGQDEDLEGVWEGYVDGDTTDTIYMELNSDGTASLGGEVMQTAGENASYTYTTDGNHLEISSMVGMYKGYYVYEYDSLSDTLTLYMIASSIMNYNYDGNELSPGVRIDMIKSASSFDDLTSSSDYNPYDYLY